MFTIEVKDEGVHAALSALVRRVENTKPLLEQIGNMIVERSKLRFETSVGPDGKRWAPNARSTIEAFIAKRRGFGKNRGVGKRGKGINKKGLELVAGKKPLIGESKDLSRQFHVSADATSVTIGNSAIYSAIHQFGGQAGKGKKVKIPARPFLPIMESGELYPAERATILDQINDYLAGRGFAK